MYGLRGFDDRPFLGTHTPDSYYQIELQVNPGMAEYNTKQACLNSGTSAYNPLYQKETAFNFKPLTEEEKKPYYDYQREFEKERIRMHEQEEISTAKRFKKTIWYKIYKFLGGY